MGFRIPSRYAVSPPDLAANAPVLNVLEPLRVNFFPMPWEETNQMIPHHDVKRLFLFRIFQKPLFANTRFDWHFTTLAEPNVVFVGFDFGK